MSLSSDEGEATVQNRAVHDDIEEGFELRSDGREPERARVDSHQKDGPRGASEDLNAFRELENVFSGTLQQQVVDAAQQNSFRRGVVWTVDQPLAVRLDFFVHFLQALGFTQVSEQHFVVLLLREVLVFGEVQHCVVRPQLGFGIPCTRR